MQVIDPLLFTPTLVLSPATVWKFVFVKQVSLWCCSLVERGNKCRHSRAFFNAKGTEVRWTELISHGIGMGSSKASAVEVASFFMG